MNPRERKQLHDKIQKEYWSQNQHLYIASIEQMGKSANSLSIYTYDKKKREYGTYLFDIQNYNVFFDAEITYGERKWYTTFDAVKAACVVGYIDRTYTLPKFTTITKEDIVEKARKFANKELDCFLFNFEFLDDKTIEKLSKPKLIYDERYLWTRL